MDLAFLSGVLNHHPLGLCIEEVNLVRVCCSPNCRVWEHGQKGMGPVVPVLAFGRGGGGSSLPKIDGTLRQVVRVVCSNGWRFNSSAPSWGESLQLGRSVLSTSSPWDVMHSLWLPPGPASGPLQHRGIPALLPKGKEKNLFPDFCYLTRAPQFALTVLPELCMFPIL